jgi:hypothetical protein
MDACDSTGIQYSEQHGLLQTQFTHDFRIKAGDKEPLTLFNFRPRELD